MKSRQLAVPSKRLTSSHYLLYQRADDTNLIIAHMEYQNFPEDTKSKNISGNAGHSSEANYAWLERKQINNFLKYDTFTKEQHPPRKAEWIDEARFQSANFPYDPAKDEFTCPAQHPMIYLETRLYKTTTGYLSESRFYECAHCSTCPFKPKCNKAKYNRRIQVSLELQRYCQQAKEEMLSSKAWLCARNRLQNPNGFRG